MKRIYLLLAAYGFALAAYGEQSAIYNPYVDRMGRLEDEAKANPSDKTALQKLEHYTTDKDFWNRDYATRYLGDLAFHNVGGYQVELIPYLHRALKDPEYGVRQAGVQAIEDIGSPAVEESYVTLLQIIQQGEEDDVTWSSTRAIGALRNPKEAQSALTILLKAANAHPPQGTPDNAPQIRYFALDSIAELSKKNNLNVIPSLEKLLNENKPSCKKHVAQIILKLDPENKVAQQAINSGESNH